MSKYNGHNCPFCNGRMVQGSLAPLDIPHAEGLYQCDVCEGIFRDNNAGSLENVTVFFDRLVAGDDRVRMALSDDLHVVERSVMETASVWRAGVEMLTLSFMGDIQQRLAQMENRLHSIKKRLGELGLAGADVTEALELIDEALDLASPSPSRERGTKEIQDVFDM